MKRIRTRALSVLMAMTMAVTMFVAAPTAAHALPGDYNTGDIAVINNIIATNGLGWTPDAIADGDVIPADWTGVTWSGNPGDTNRRIVELYLYNEGLTGALDVSGLDALEELNCNYNNLTALDVSGLTNLVNLYCNGNDFAALDVSDNVALVTLSCSGNSLTALDVSNLSDLEYLFCGSNNLSTLDVSGNTALVDLSCQINSLSALDVTNLANLKFLNCSGNNLSTLDVSGNIELVSLDCYTNNLSTLNLTGLTKLAVLNCNSNNLSALTLTGFTNLESLKCYYNNLTALDVTGLTKLYYLDCCLNFMSDASKVTGVGTTMLPAVDSAVGATLFNFSPQKVYFCEIVGGAQYASIDDALAAVANGQTIRLLTDVTLSGLVDPWLPIDNSKTFTFDTNGFTLDFNDYGLEVTGGSKVNFVGCTEFDNLAWLNAYQNGTEVEFDSDLVFYVGHLYADNGAVVIVNGSLTCEDNDGIQAYRGASVTINGDITAKYDGVYASEATITVDGDIYAGYWGVKAYSGAIVTVLGDIYADEIGIFAVGEEISVTVDGDIFAGAVGIYIESMDGPGAWSKDIEITVSGNITAEDGELWNDIFGIGIFAMECDGLTINVGGDIDAYYAGVVVICLDALVFIDGNITAGYHGAMAFFDVQIFIYKSIVVTSAVPLVVDGEDDILVGAASGFGGKITIDGTITAANYIALYFEMEELPNGDTIWYFDYVGANQNKSSTSKSGYLEYNDSDDPTLEFISFVWVKDTTTTVPGTGDGTALALLLGALMVAALGTGLVFAHKRRRQDAE